MALYPTGNSAFDQAARVAQATRDAAEAVPGLTQAAATAAAKNYFVSIIAAGAANNVLTINEQSALNAINSTGAP
jgi:hypothetical protein